MKKRHLLLAVVLCLSLACVPALAGDTAVKSSHAKARKVLDAGMDALGGPEALRELETLSFSMRGSFAPRFQMTSSQPPFKTGERAETVVLDLKDNRIAAEQKGANAGFEFWNRVVVKGSDAWNVDLRNRTVTAAAPGSTNQPQFVQYYRRMPALMLRSALDRALTLRWLGEDTFRGRKHNVITFSQPDGSQVALYFDVQNNLLSKYELLFPDPITGEEAAEIEFAEYRQYGKLKFPTVWRQILAGEAANDLKVTALAVNPKLEPSLFELPKDFETAPTPAQNRPVSVSKLADDVIVVREVAGGGYNVLAVAFKDHILVVEAPISSAASDAAITRIKQELPGKPIKYVAITHHHGDHSGGLRSFIAEGATVVTTPGNRRYVEMMAAAKQNDRLGKNPHQATIETISGKKRAFSDGTQALELYDIGPNPHADEMVVAYLPKLKVLFQGDLLNLPVEGGPLTPAQPTTAQFADAVEKLGLQVDKIVGVHGRDSTVAELRQTVEKYNAMKPAGSSTPGGGNRY